MISQMVIGQIAPAARDVWREGIVHLGTAALIVALGVVVGLALALVVGRFRYLVALARLLGTVVTLVPPVAVVAVFFPKWPYGYRPVALVSASVAGIVLHAALTGVQHVDRELTHTATAIGLSNWQRIGRVALPLARPSVVAAARRSVAAAVGLTFVFHAAFEGGLGAVASNAQRDANPSIVALCVAAAVLVWRVLDTVLRLFDRLVASPPS